MMRLVTQQIVSLGYGTFVRSDDVVAIVPLTDTRGPGRRCLVWVRGLAEPLVSSRSEAALVEDLVTPSEQAATLRNLREVQKRVVQTLQSVPPVLRRVIDEEAGVDVNRLLRDAKRALGETAAR